MITEPVKMMTLRLQSSLTCLLYGFRTDEDDNFMITEFVQLMTLEVQRWENGYFTMIEFAKVMALSLHS